MARLKLEVFEKPEEQPDQIALGPVEFEEAKLASFEQGYSAGWEDAIAAQDAESARLRGDLGRNLLQLSASYEEIRTHFLAAIDPLLRDMVSKIMPRIARETLSHIVLEHLRPDVRAALSTPIRIVASPASLPQIRTLLEAEVTMPLRFIEEPTLSEGQVYLRMTDTETRVDLDGVIEAIGAAIETYFTLESPESHNE
jgi:flagellar assembly protein FliH